MAESAKLRFKAANSRDVVRRSVWCESAKVSAIWFQKFWIGGFQNLPISVCSGVLVALVADPRLCTSLMAAAYASLVNEGGDAGRTGRPWRARTVSPLPRS
jgi:hypothetical protein